MILLLAVNINSSAQKEDKVYVDAREFDKTAVFKDGGTEGIKEFIKNNIVYPKSALEKKYSAKMFVQFVVDYNGKVRDPKILHSTVTDENGYSGTQSDIKAQNTPPPSPPALYMGKNEKTSKVEKAETKPTKPGLVIDPTALNDLKAEAIRVIKSMPDFIPAQKDGKNISTMFAMPIAFHYKK
jgi:hypothetical protein